MGHFVEAGGDGCADEAGGCVPGDRPNAGMGSGNCLYEVLMSVRIPEIREATHPISSAIANCHIDFFKMTYSLVAVVTNAIRDGRRVVGYGFNSNGRYGQGGLVRKRFAPRVLEAGPASLLDESGSNPDSDGIWATRGSLRGRATLRIANGSQAFLDSRRKQRRCQKVLT
jgi:hypothetical protein